MRLRVNASLAGPNPEAMTGSQNRVVPAMTRARATSRTVFHIRMVV